MEVRRAVPNASRPVGLAIAMPQKPYQPDWNRRKNAAPFKRNDAMLDVMPRGVIVFLGTGIQDNLADKARKLGIKAWAFGQYTG